MEIIRLAGYTEDEKINIAMKYLLPKELKTHGLKATEINISEAVIRDIVRYYTREAGVRRLEQEIAKICRKVVKELLLNQTRVNKARRATDATTKESATTAPKKVNITSKNLEKYLGVYRYDYGVAAKDNQVGQVTGLAWTSVGGELLTIEAVLLPGKGKTITTGKLGDVMQESVQAAMSVVRSRAARLGISEDFYEKKDIHIHLPEGATPKDGPSAGIGLATALVSVLTGIPARADVAMTGEITLRGEVLAIGGLKEKLLAAHRGGIKTVLIPESNVKDLIEIPENIKNQLVIHPVKWIDQVLELALESIPQSLAEKTVEIPAVVGETVTDVNLPVTH
jgi:ATP-dependent Lon protease